MNSANKLQVKIFKLLDGSEYSKVSRFIEFFIVAIVVLNVLVIILESVQTINQRYGTAFFYFEVFSVVVFTIEYILRVWSYGVKYKKDEGGSWKGKKGVYFFVLWVDRFFCDGSILLAIIISRFRSQIFACF